MRPEQGQTVDRPDLGALAYEYLLSQVAYIGLRIMPVFDVPEQSMQYPVIPIEAVLKQPGNLARASRSAYPRGDWEWKMNTFSCVEHGWEEPIDDKEAALYRRFFTAESVSTEIATAIILRNHEGLVQAKLGASANTSAGSNWADAVNATPYADIDTARQSMRKNAGIVPNALALSKTSFDRCIATNEIKEYLQYTSPHLMQGMEAQRDTLARYFGVDEVLVGDVQQDNAPRGKSKSQPLGDVWPDTEGYLCRVSTGGDNLREPSVGRTFLWTGDAPNLLTVESYREEQTRSDIIRVRTDTDEAVQYAGAIMKVTGIGT